MIDFDAISGPKSSKHSNFAQLVGEMLVRECNAFSIDGSGGDGGIDSYMRDESGSLTVFQIKYFRGRIHSDRRPQVVHSFKRALGLHHQMVRWILCTPVDPTPKEALWLDSLVGDTRIVVEWWGETYLRSLISKHADLVATFFVENKILKEMREMRQEIQDYQAVARDTFWRHYEGNPEVAYLREASHLVEKLTEDSPLISCPEESLIAVDFCELYTYMATEPRFALSTPIVNHCLENSKILLALPPGSAFELGQYARGIAGGKPMNFAIAPDKVDVLESLRDAFVKEYERYPGSPAAESAYKLLVAEIPVRPNRIGFIRLAELLKNGRLSEWPAKVLDPANDRFFARVLSSLRMRRGARQLANLADALNLCAVTREAETRGGHVRLLSSALQIREVGLEVLEGPMLVRTSREYALFLHFAQASQVPDSEASYLSQVSRLQKAVSGISEILPELGELLSGRSVQKRESLDALTQFASVYRDWLQPIDRMLESGLQVARKSLMGEMSDLYDVLTSQSKLASAFRIWLERICAAASEVEACIVERYDFERTEAWLKGAGRKSFDENRSLGQKELVA